MKKEGVFYFYIFLSQILNGGVDPLPKVLRVKKILL